MVVEWTQRTTLPMTGVDVDLIRGPDAERDLAGLTAMLRHEPIAGGPSSRKREDDPLVPGTSTCAVTNRVVIAIRIGQDIASGSEAARRREGNRRCRQAIGF